LTIVFNKAGVGKPDSGPEAFNLEEKKTKRAEKDRSDQCRSQEGVRGYRKPNWEFGFNARVK